MMAKSLVAALASALCLLGSQPMAAQTLLSPQPLRNLKAAFDPLFPPGSQYAVLSFNNTSELLSPGPGPQSLWTNNWTGGLRTWILAAGSYGATNHGEYQLAQAAPAAAANFTFAFNEQITTIAVYSRLGPCGSCAQSLSQLVGNNGWAGPHLFGFSSQWANQSDVDAHVAIRTLETAGFQVARICENPSDCWTFQRRLRQCALDQAIICRDCVNRAQGVSGFINDTLNANHVRTASVWVAAIQAQPYSSPELAAQVLAAWTPCISAAAPYPIGESLSTWGYAAYVPRAQPSGWWRTEIMPLSPNPLGKLTPINP